jgi:hypothetical protein
MDSFMHLAEKRIEKQIEQEKTFNTAVVQEAIKAAVAQSQKGSRMRLPDKKQVKRAKTASDGTRKQQLLELEKGRLQMQLEAERQEALRKKRLKNLRKARRAKKKKKAKKK